MSSVDELFDITNKVVFLTGAASGIGEAFAKELVKRGAFVIGTYHNKKISKVLLSEQKNFIPYHLDLENINPAQIDEIWNLSIAKLKKVPNILINCAGINLRSKIEEYPLNDWNKVLDINLTTPFKLCQSFAQKHIDNHTNAKIINVSSLTAFQTGRMCTGYTVSKHGINALTKILANELGEYGITANCIAPGYIKTDMTYNFLQNKEVSESYFNRIALKRWGEPSDLVGTLVFLCSNASNYITGSTIVVDGGYINT